MAKQDDWVRLTVRMPPELYERLQAIVASGPKSMNAEIVSRLEDSLNPLRGIDDPNVARSTDRLLQLLLDAAKASVDNDRVFFIGSRKIGDDPEEDALLGLTPPAKPQPD